MANPTDVYIAPTVVVDTDGADAVVVTTGTEDTARPAEDLVSPRLRSAAGITPGNDLDLWTVTLSPARSICCAAVLFEGAATPAAQDHRCELDFRLSAASQVSTILYPLPSDQYPDHDANGGARWASVIFGWDETVGVAAPATPAVTSFSVDEITVKMRFTSANADGYWRIAALLLGTAGFTLPVLPVGSPQVEPRHGRIGDELWDYRLTWDAGSAVTAAQYASLAALYQTAPHRPVMVFPVPGQTAKSGVGYNVSTGATDGQWSPAYRGGPMILQPPQASLGAWVGDSVHRAPQLTLACSTWSDDAWGGAP